MLVPVLLSLDTFPYVSITNLVLLKLYSLVPQNKISVRYRCAYCLCHCFPFSTNIGAGYPVCTSTFPLPFLFESRHRFMLYNFPHYVPPFLSSLNHVLDSCYTTFPLLSPLPFLFEPRPRFMLYNFPHYFSV